MMNIIFYILLFIAGILTGVLIFIVKNRKLLKKMIYDRKNKYYHIYLLNDNKIIDEDYISDDNTAYITTKYGSFIKPENEKITEKNLTNYLIRNKEIVVFYKINNAESLKIGENIKPQKITETFNPILHKTWLQATSIQKILTTQNTNYKYLLYIALVIIAGIFLFKIMGLI